jgi:Zn-finger nucleic acid-binding protein
MEVAVRGEGSDLVEIDLCPSCDGIWLDARELAKLDDNFFLNVESMPLDEASPTEEDALLRCPRCEGAPVLLKVHPVDFEDVVLDTCSACRGFWLDKGELEKVRNVSDRLLIASLILED